MTDDEVIDQAELMSLEDAKKRLEEVSSFLEAHAQANMHPRTLRVHHELDIQTSRLEEIIENKHNESTEGDGQSDE